MPDTTVATTDLQAKVDNFDRSVVNAWTGASHHTAPALIIAASDAMTDALVSFASAALGETVHPSDVHEGDILSRAGVSADLRKVVGDLWDVRTSLVTNWIDPGDKSAREYANAVKATLAKIAGVN